MKKSIWVIGAVLVLAVAMGLLFVSCEKAEAAAISPFTEIYIFDGEDFIIQDNGHGVCQINIPLEKAESSIITPPDDISILMVTGTTPLEFMNYGSFQDPNAISSLIVKGIRTWQKDNPEKEIKFIFAINTYVAPQVTHEEDVAESATIITNGAILLYE